MFALICCYGIFLTLTFAVLRAAGRSDQRLEAMYLTATGAMRTSRARPPRILAGSDELDARGNSSRCPA